MSRGLTQRRGLTGLQISRQQCLSRLQCLSMGSCMRCLSMGSWEYAGTMPDPWGSLGLNGKMGQGVNMPCVEGSAVETDAGSGFVTDYGL